MGILEQYFIFLAIGFVISIIINFAFDKFAWKKRNEKLKMREDALTDLESQYKNRVAESAHVVPIEPIEIKPIERLSAQEFIQKMRDAESWCIKTGYIFNSMYREVELTVYVKNGPAECFLGPDPLETHDWVYKDFIDALTEITGVSKSVINFTVNRIEGT